MSVSQVMQSQLGQPVRAELLARSRQEVLKGPGEPLGVPGLPLGGPNTSASSRPSASMIDTRLARCERNVLRSADYS